MSSLTLRITTKSPLLLAAGPHNHNLIETLDFIPGNSLRGLLAHSYLSDSGSADDPLFYRLFLSGEIRYGFAFINGAHVVPLSSRSCKYDGGFRQDGYHGVTDMLFPEKDERICTECGKTLDYFEGFYDPLSYSRQKVRTRLITRTAIDPISGRASNGKLFTQRVIEENQTFLLTVEAPDDLIAEIEKLIPKGITLGLGTGRSRGQGWVEMGKVLSDPFPWGKARERSMEFEEKVLSVTLSSDAIFQDEYLRDMTAPNIFHLNSFGLTPDEWESEPYRAFAAHRAVFGFDGIPLQLPRIPRLAVSAGSVFLFRSKSSNPYIPLGDGIGWIGDKNSEGFGQAILWHPFHIGLKKEAVL